MPVPAGDQREQAAGLHRGQLPGVADPDHPRPGLQGERADPRQVLRGHLRGLVDHQDVTPADRHLAREEPGDVPRLGEPLPRGDPGRVLPQGQADDPAAGDLRPRRAERGHHVRFPGPGRGDQAGEEPVAGEHPGHGPPLLRVQVGAGQRGRGPALGDQLRHGPLGGLLQDPFLGVDVRGGDEPFLARRPVHRRAVLAVIQGGHVDQVRHRGDPDHASVRDPPGQRVIGHRVQVRAPVRGRGQDRHLPVQLPLQVGAGPRGVLPLHLGDRRADDPVPLRRARQLPGHRFGMLQRVRLGRCAERASSWTLASRALRIHPASASSAARARSSCVSVPPCFGFCFAVRVSSVTRLRSLYSAARSGARP